MNPEFTTIALRVGGMSRQALAAALTAAHIARDDAARTLLQTMPVYPGERSYPIRLGLMHASDLGLGQGATLPRLTQTAQHYGLGLVPLAAAVYLRLQWRTQAPGQVFVASPALSNSGPRGFVLVNTDSRLQLHGFYAGDDEPVEPNTTFAFELSI
ncbi:hypothetical protein [Lacticaseibacillus hegangensis]|uniref:Uncharacterized protein n=1 Tax=Lacticaseibacillus hegangensis TaxID=2486010 RepID=A0ABW4CS94_9LACO|nr:hypothetical protein [Lacticaseibacillus hegangensis]